MGLWSSRGQQAAEADEEAGGEGSGGVMCTAGSVIALKRKGKMIIVGIIGRGARSQPLLGKAYIEFHSGPKVIKMKYIETRYSTHSYGRPLVFTPCFTSFYSIYVLS